MVRIRLWDLPTRVFHWSLLACVAAAFATGWSGGNAMVWHGRCGIVIIGLLSFRVVWGFVGSTHARFGSFVRGPAAILAYLRGRWQGVGHNPLGALSVLAMLALLACQAIGGLFANDDIAFNGPYYSSISKDLSDWISGWHKRGAVLNLALVAMHVAAIVYYLGVRKENLVLPMLHGEKDVAPVQAGESARGGGLPAFLMAAMLAALVAWLASGRLLPGPAASEPVQQNSSEPTTKPANPPAW